MYLNISLLNFIIESHGMDEWWVCHMNDVCIKMIDEEGSMYVII